MGQKGLLISSMQKLINHIRKSQSNQQEIFYSLSRTDFKKILSNLQDDNPMLRKTSLNLIAELLSQNTKLKKKFCHTMEINLIPGKVSQCLKKILFNSKTLQRHVSTGNLRNVLGMLKKQPDSIQSNCLVWYINSKSPTRQLQMQYIQKDRSRIQMQIDLDPQECMVGFCLSEADISMQHSTTNLSKTTATEVSQQFKRGQLKNLIQSNPKKVISLAGSKTNSSMSDSQPRYQRNSKNSHQVETERPKKYINSFLQQRKLNISKGAETQRYNTLSSQNSHIMPTQSYQIPKQYTRSTMPKTTQSPYIPVLNLQNSSNNYGYKTDRISQSYSSTSNRSKEMDFQKIKYQGIKITTNPTSRASYGNNVARNNTDRDHPSNYTTSNGYLQGNSYMTNSVSINQQPINRRQVENSFNFKYIKPMTATNQQGVKVVNFFHKKNEEQPPLMEKKTIDVFQFIKNK